MNVIQYVGLDVHNDSIAISIAPSDCAEVRRYGIIGGRHIALVSCFRSKRKVTMREKKATAMALTIGIPIRRRLWMESGSPESPKTK